MMLDNPNFSGQFDICPYIELNMNNKRHWANVMLANIAWNHCVSTHFCIHCSQHTDSDIFRFIKDAIANSHPDTHRAMYCPIILGSDKTTISVTIEHVEYHPLYLSIGNVHNTVRCGHHTAVIPITFLAIPKSKSLLFDYD
jgi:Plavaka transposase